MAGAASISAGGSVATTGAIEQGETTGGAATSQLHAGAGTNASNSGAHTGPVINETIEQMAEICAAPNVI